MKTHLEDFLNQLHDGRLLLEEVMRDMFQSKMGNRVAARHQLEMAGLIANSFPAGFMVEQDGGGFYECSIIRGEEPYALTEQLAEIFHNAGLIRTSLHRAQNVVTLTPHSDDIVNLYTQIFLEKFVDVVNVFDSCNDPINLETAYRSISKAGLIICGNVCFDPAKDEALHDTVRRIGDMARIQKDMGANMLRVKDMMGILAIDYVRALCEELKPIGLPFGFHSHDILGVGVQNYSEAFQLGAQFVATAISSWGGGNSHPFTEAVFMQNQSSFPGLELEKLIEYRKKAKLIREKYAMVDSKMDVMDPQSAVLPGGMLGPLLQQMDQLGISREKLSGIISLVEKVRHESRERIARVTPASQIIGVQAIRYYLDDGYTKISSEFAKLLQGWFGQVQGEVTGQLAEQHPDLKEFRYNLRGKQISPELKHVIDSNPAAAHVKFNGETYLVHRFPNDTVGNALRKHFGDYIVNRSADFMKTEHERSQAAALALGSWDLRDILGIALLGNAYVEYMKQRKEGKTGEYNPPTPPPKHPIYPTPVSGIHQVSTMMKGGEYLGLSIWDNMRGQKLTFRMPGVEPPKEVMKVKKVDISPGDYDLVVYSSLTGPLYLRPSPTEKPYLEGILEFVVGDRSREITVKEGHVVAMVYPMKQAYEQRIGMNASPELPNSMPEFGATYQLVAVFAPHGSHIVEPHTPLMAFKKISNAGGEK